MKNPFTALFRARDKPRDSVSTAPTFYFGTSGSGNGARPSGILTYLRPPTPP